jgi:hypothetical protein
MPEEGRRLLTTIATILEEGGDAKSGRQVRKVVDADEGAVWTYLISNELWGGPGSIADQGLTSGEGRSTARRRLEKALTDLGEWQLSQGKFNVRTEMWVDAFRQWEKAGI